MSQNDDLQALKRDIEKLQQGFERHDSILRGDPATAKGGLAAMAEKTAIAVFGDDKSEGLIDDSKKRTKLVWMGMGGLVVFELLRQYGPWVLKVLTP